jgi:heme/copper-type cytochrome/quinol oxidase subunit 3
LMNVARTMPPADPLVAADPQVRSRATSSVGMAIALGALTMTFAALFLAYAIVRSQAAAWPPPGEAAAALAWPWPIAATVAALAGSVAMRAASRANRESAHTLTRGAEARIPMVPAMVQAASTHTAVATVPVPQRTATTITTTTKLKRALRMTAAAGVIFIGVQISGWVGLAAAGLRPSAGMVVSVVYALTLFHALHALAALLALLWLLRRVSSGPLAHTSALDVVAAFWHFVTIVWLVVFFAVFVA